MGIYEALSQVDGDAVELCVDGLGVKRYRLETEERRAIVQQALIDCGHIAEYETLVTDVGAAEYEEAMAAQELLG